MYVPTFWVGYAAGVASLLVLCVGLALYGQWLKKREIGQLAARARELRPGAEFAHPSDAGETLLKRAD